MTKTLRFLLVLYLLALLFASCAPKPSFESQLQQAVAATVAALPTQTPYSTLEIHSLPTLLNLSGLFCEYQFCIGHPPEIAFFDVSAQRDPVTPSNYTQGLMAAYNTNLFIELIWQHAPGTSDPKFLLDLILEGEMDELTGKMDVMLIREMNVLYSAISTTTTDILPYGGTAAWTCGDRVFAWKVYTPIEDQAIILFEEAIQRFRCSTN